MTKAEMDIQINNVHGQEVWNYADQFNGAFLERIDLSDHAAGVYLVKVTLDGKSVTKRVMIQ